MTVEHLRDMIGGLAPVPGQQASRGVDSAPALASIPDCPEEPALNQFSITAESSPSRDAAAEARAAEWMLLPRLLAEQRQPPVAPYRRPGHHLIDAIHDAEAEWELDRHGRRVA